MTYRLNTKRKPGVVKLTISNKSNLFIKGFDPAFPKRVFFKRMITDKGHDEVYNFGIPLSSKFIDINILDYGQSGFRIDNIQYEKLRRKPVYVDKLTKHFLNFSKNFSYMAHTYGVGRHIDKQNIFKVDILPDLDGTPARINIHNNLIEMSKRTIEDDTVAGINWLLVHEYAHNYINDDEDSEHEADYHANELYLSLGYPLVESYNMVASFSDTELNKSRLVHTADMLDEYEKKLNLNK